ncbi:DUF1566 domain-containing protein [Sorangium sp. So ce117]|uniref:Lcl C-terminal domain-containing protein n=1 Tax=Sorangium sp. So ce117 TaxID=3133277 RepID=UPI003F5F7EC1
MLKRRAECSTARLAQQPYETRSGVGHRGVAVDAMMSIDDRRAGPALDLEAFPTTPSDVFWSSTPSIGSAEKAVLVNFANGASQDHTVRHRRLVRCVRSDASPELLARLTPGRTWPPLSP